MGKPSFNRNGHVNSTLLFADSFEFMDKARALLVRRRQSQQLIADHNHHQVSKIVAAKEEEGQEDDDDDEEDDEQVVLTWEGRRFNMRELCRSTSAHDKKVLEYY